MMDFPNAVTTRSAFYDREEGLEKATQAILNRAQVPVVIIGERRIGKTSLQNVVMEAVCKEDPNYVALQIEPRSITTVDQFAEAVLRQLTMRLKRDIRDTGLFDSRGILHIDAPDQFDLGFQRILPTGCTEKFVLCIDEFDEIVRLVTKTGEVERGSFFGLIHHLIEGSRLPLKLLFTMTRVPDPMKAEVPSSLMTKSQVIELLPFEDSESQGMVEWLLLKSNLTLQSGVLEQISRLAGGHPYYIKLLVSNLTGVGQQPDGLSIGMSELNSVILPRALDDSRANYAIENLYKAQFSPSEKSVLLYLAERREPVDASEFLAAGREIVRAVRNLENRHYLDRQDGKYSTRIQFLEYWFRNWAEFEEELERLNVHHIAGVGMTDPAMTNL